MNIQSNNTSIAAHVFAETSVIIRTVTLGDDIMFIAEDVAEALGYEDIKDAITTHCDDIMGLPAKVTGSRSYLVSVPDVYSLIFHSKTPSAKAFKQWVTKEVLPSLRKVGNRLDDKQIRDLIEGGSTILRLGIQSTDNLRAILAMESVCALFDTIDNELTQRIDVELNKSIDIELTKHTDKFLY